MLNLIPIIISSIISKELKEKIKNQPKIIGKLGSVTKNMLKKRSVIAILIIGIVVTANNYFQLGIDYDEIVHAIDKILLELGK